MVIVPVRGMSCIPGYIDRLAVPDHVIVPVRGMSCIALSGFFHAQKREVIVPVRGMSCIGKSKQTKADEMQQESLSYT